MKKIRTVEQLNDYLDEQIAWRKQELANIKSLIHRASGSQENSLVRGGVALLYAHWEGFVRETGTAYLRFVGMQGLDYADLSTSLVALAMKRQLDDATSSNRASIYTGVAEFFRSGLKEKSSIPWKDGIDTKANLSSGVFREIAVTLGLEYKFYQTKEKLLDERLLGSRNRITHGHYTDESARDYTELHEQVIGLMNRLRNDIVNAAEMEGYKLK